MWQPELRRTKIGVLSGVIAVTLGIHYGWLIEPIFGHVHWVHAIHGRFCYIPIVIAAVWFGTRGSVLVAAVISVLVMPYIVSSGLEAHALADELVEIVFYFAIALLSGILLDREMRATVRAQDARLQLERSQKLSLVGQIAAGMAHEIKNPLASIKGAVEIMNDEATSPSEMTEFRAIVFKEIKRVNQSVTDFLQFARPTEAELRSVDLTETVSDCIRQLKVQASDHGVSIASDLEEGVVAEADQQKIHQVMLNLILNAVQASPESSEIRVRLRRDELSRKVVVSVEDAGSGLDDQDSTRLFEPFYSTKPSGSGLGLAIARSIVEKHGGTISLQNAPKGGALATVELPLRASK